jgi:hypothetical protein
MGDQNFSAARKKHRPDEILAKLQLAKKMEAQGSRQIEIAKALDVSLMTYHRWRKRPPVKVDGETEAPVLVAPLRKDGKGVTQLRTENAQLRRMVIELLLQKVQLEETLRAQSTRRRGRRYAGAAGTIGGSS